MKPWLIIYCTQDGQTGRIANHMAQRIDGRFCDVRVRNIDHARDEELEQCGGVIIGASIHGNQLPKIVRAFIQRNAERLATLPSGLYSVSLSAASPDARVRRRARELTDALTRGTEWQPQASAAFAGAINPADYGFWRRLQVRWAISRTIGRSPSQEPRELTDWHAVGAFVDSLVPP